MTSKALLLLFLSFPTAVNPQWNSTEDNNSTDFGAPLVIIVEKESKNDSLLAKHLGENVEAIKNDSHKNLQSNIKLAKTVSKFATHDEKFSNSSLQHMRRMEEAILALNNRTMDMLHYLKELRRSVKIRTKQAHAASERMVEMMASIDDVGWNSRKTKENTYYTSSYTNKILALVGFGLLLFVCIGCCKGLMQLWSKD